MVGVERDSVVKKDEESIIAFRVFNNTDESVGLCWSAREAIRLPVW